MKGDELIPVDSGNVTNDLIRFRLHDDARTGMYRIDMGQTRSARILDEPPQTLDFIFNGEDIALSLDFKSPLNSVEVMTSEENENWFRFYKKLSLLDDGLNILKKLLENYELKEQDKIPQTASDYNQYNLERDLLIDDFIQQHPGLFATHLAETYKRPIIDGFLSSKEQKEELINRYFEAVHFDQPKMIYTSRYTDLVFDYLVLYNNPDYTKEERMIQYRRALDVLMPRISENKEVKDFLTAYLKRGFLILQMDELVDYLSERN